MIITIPMLIQLGVAVTETLIKVLDHVNQTGDLPEQIDMDDYKLKSALEILEEERKKRG